MCHKETELAIHWFEDNYINLNTGKCLVKKWSVYVNLKAFQQPRIPFSHYLMHNLNIANLNFKLKIAHSLHPQNIQTLETYLLKIHHGFSKVSFLDLFHNHNENNFYSFRFQPNTILVHMIFWTNNLSGLKLIDKSSHKGINKVWILQNILILRLRWPLLIYEISISVVNCIEHKISSLLRKILQLTLSLCLWRV